MISNIPENKKELEFISKLHDAIYVGSVENLTMGPSIVSGIITHSNSKISTLFTFSSNVELFDEDSKIIIIEPDNVFPGGKRKRYMYTFSTIIEYGDLD